MCSGNSMVISYHQNPHNKANLLAKQIIQKKSKLVSHGKAKLIDSDCMFLK